MGIFGGIACHMLELLEDECKSAAKFVTSIQDGNKCSSPLQSSDSWRSEQQVRQSIRSKINSCMNLHGQYQYSDLILPLSLQSCDFEATSHTSQSCNKSLFLASAYAAMSLEPGALSYRLHGKSPGRSMIGLLSRYFDGSGQGGDDWYSSTPKLTFHEFIALLKPTNRHCLLELSSLLHPSETRDLRKRFFHGTSIDRQIKEIQGYRGSIDTSRDRPGGWLDNHGIKNGILSSWTPTIQQPHIERSLHRHLAFSSSFRGDLYNTSPLNQPLRNHTSSLMEAMGFGYRPESCVGTVVNQSLFELTHTGPASAAGLYWKGIMNREGRFNAPEISVLSNSTSIYPFINETIKGMSDAVSRKNYGYVTQDTMSGIIPERDDCVEALDSCFDLRELYEPPPGSGLIIDEEGRYFDDNTE